MMLWGVLATIFVGVLFLVFTHAATPVLSIESESGSLSPKAQQVSDSTASKGKAVKFTGSTAASCTGGKFYVVRNQIIDPNCKVFLPMGANIALTPGYTFNWNGTANGHVDDVKAWGWNTIRLTTVCNNANGTNDQASFYAGIDSVIAEYTAKQVVVMLECHDYTGQNPNSATASSLYGFYDRMTVKYNTNPYVWFNPINEPYSGNSASDIENWLTMQQAVMARIRQNAPNNVFIADIPGYGQGTSSFKGTNSITRLGSGKCNVVYAWHNYGAVSNDYNTNNNEATNLQATIDMFTYLRDNGIPVIIGEIGDPLTLSEGTAGSPQWNRWGAYNTIAQGPQRGIGILWWHATGDSSVFLTYSLMADRHAAPWSAASSGAGLSTGGLKFWQMIKALPAPATFTGNLAQSNCP